MLKYLSSNDSACGTSLVLFETKVHPRRGRSAVLFCYPWWRSSSSIHKRDRSVMNTSELAATAHALVAKHRGILAADESTGTIAKRFGSIKLESTEENRRAYREMLFTTPGVGEFVSGVILYDETLRQKTKDGQPFPGYLSEHGMIPGIKVDT